MTPTFATIDGVQRELTGWPVTVDGVVRDLGQMFGNIDGVQREIFGTSYQWFRYSCQTVTSYEEIHSTSETLAYEIPDEEEYQRLFNSYTFDQTTGKFMYSNSPSDYILVDYSSDAGEGVGNYWFPSLSTSGQSAIYKITRTGSERTTEGEFRFRLYGNLYVSKSKTAYEKGDYIDVVESSSQNAYPENGRHTDGYWYVRKSTSAIRLDTIPEGTVIQLMENSVPADFYVAKHSYESAVNGTGRTLLVRKKCCDACVWDASKINAYAESDVDMWLNGTYKESLDAEVRSAMGTTAIPCTPGNGDTTTATLRRGVFLLSLTELGLTHANVNTEGTALPIASVLQIAHHGETAVDQWTRSPGIKSKTNAFRVTAETVATSTNANLSYYPRPAFTLPGDYQILI